jgi:hypothetical protein
LLFDPRSDEYFDPDGCDLKYNESKLLADWLALNKTNTLVMLAGKVTTQPVDDLDHAGIRKKLFPEIRSHALVKWEKYPYAGCGMQLRLYETRGCLDQTSKTR